MLWLGLGISGLIVDLLLLRLMLAAIGVGVSIYLYRLPEYELSKDEKGITN